MDKDSELGNPIPANPKDQEEVNYWSKFQGRTIELLRRMIMTFSKSIITMQANLHLFPHKYSRTNHKLSIRIYEEQIPRVNDVIFDIDPNGQANTFKKELLKYMKILNKI